MPDFLLKSATKWSLSVYHGCPHCGNRDTESFLQFSTYDQSVFTPVNWVVVCLTLLMRGGGTMCHHFFQMAISPWKKESGGPKFLDFSWFIMNFQKIKRFFGVFYNVFGNLEGVDTFFPLLPPTQATFKSPVLIGLILIHIHKKNSILAFSHFIQPKNYKQIREGSYYRNSQKPNEKV